jgi:uncharacterized protein YkwD
MLGDVHRRRRTAATATIGLGLVAPGASAATAAPPAILGVATLQPVASGVVGAPPAAVATAAPRRCVGARARAAAGPRVVRRALLCLINGRRAVHGLQPLHADPGMERAAGRHARDMARRGYFAHQRPGGPDLTARLSRAGWHGSSWGEAIAYGCAAAGTPRATVEAWMASPPHRAILLASDFRHAGVGVAASALCGSGGATWVLDAGRR